MPSARICGAGRECVAFDDVDALVGADPDAPAGILGDRLHQVAGQAGSLAELGEPALVEAIRAAALRAEPERAATVLHHGADADVVETQASREILEAAVRVAAQSRIGADPQARRRVVRLDAPGEIAGQTFAVRRTAELAVAQAQQPAAVGSDPESCLRRLRTASARRCSAQPRSRVGELTVLHSHQTAPSVAIQRFPSRSRRKARTLPAEFLPSSPARIPDAPNDSSWPLSVPSHIVPSRSS